MTINFQTEPFSVRDSSSDGRCSISPSPEMGDSLFTPPPSHKPRKRMVFDCVSVPSFPRGMIGADDNMLNASTGKPQQGVEHPSVSNAPATAFTLNDRPSSPYLSLERKEHECECPPPAPARLTKKHKPHPPKFGEDVSTAPIQILDAQHPALELDIHEPPIYLPHHNDPQSSTYCIYVRHVQRLYTQLREGLPEMIAEMKDEGSRSSR
jgi:hypothetical protein